MTTTIDRLTCNVLLGLEAIAYAREHGLRLSRYCSSSGPARDGLTPDEAEEIAKQDSRLIFLSVLGRAVATS